MTGLSKYLFKFLLYFYFIILPLSITPKSEESSFSKMSFLKLDGSIIQAIAVKNILQCCWKCDRLPECFSLNVADVPDKDGLYECQMLRTETNKYSGLLKPSQHYHHYTRLFEKCSRVKCLNGGTCESNGSFDFLCVCPHGFTGDLCEEKTSKIAVIDDSSRSLCKWGKINPSPVCYGTRNSSFGRFYVKYSVKVTSLKLVHISGFVTCDLQHQSSRSFWGCAAYESHSDKLLTIITNSLNQRILPQNEFITNLLQLEYTLPYVTSPSSELLYKPFAIPLVVAAGQEFRIWYGPDLQDNGVKTTAKGQFVLMFICVFQALFRIRKC